MSRFKSLVLSNFLLHISAATILHSAFIRTGNIYKKLASICFPLAAMFALSGCAAIQIKLGSRVDLAKLPVSSIQVSQFKGPGIAPGKKSSLVVKLTQPDGTVLTSEGKGHGKVLWRDLAVAPSVVTANKKGVVSLASDPRISEGKSPHVTVTVPSHPDLHADLDIPLRYDRAFTATFSGFSGSSGFDGQSGMDGSSGMSGSTDPNNPSAGGNGSDGSNGTDGGNGSDGDDGPPVKVLVTLKASDHPLLQVSVSSGHTENFFLVDPQGGTLTVKSLGGSGGAGGKGGRGGSGGSGGSGSPSGSNGRDGSSGQDGRNGSDGRGGSITVTYDSSAKAYLGALHLLNNFGPHPVLTEGKVGPLW
ncbi:MAG TPA: hypothetical protein VGN44_03055 [Candidatus Angelobacter sp.]|jgi:hypothetical protein